MDKKLKQIAPGLSVIRQVPLWRGDKRLYAFIHEPSGAIIHCGLLWRFEKSVVDLATKRLATMDWTKLDIGDPQSNEFYKNEFKRAIIDALAARGSWHA